MRATRFWSWAAALTAALFLAVPAVAELDSDYSPTLRPDPDGTPTRVEIGVVLLDIVSIDDLDQEFAADIHLAARWRDARLATVDSEGPEERVLLLSAVWQPTIGALNRRSMDLLLPETVTVDREGNVFYEQRFLGSFASPMDLRRFPSDRQNLAIRLASYRYSPQELELAIDSQRTGSFENVTVAGWQLGKLEAETAALAVPGAERAGAILHLEATRDSRYYKLTMVLPLLLISLMAWAVFWIDPSVLPSRIGISTASIFSLIAFRLSLSVKLPKVSYLTAADWFVLTTTVLVFAVLGETVVAGRLAKQGSEDRARLMDSRSRWVYLAALALVAGFILL